MYYVLAVVTLLVSGSTALTEDEWTDRITESFKQWNDYESGWDFDGILAMYGDPMVQMVPGKPAMDRTAYENYLRYEHKNRANFVPISEQFRELIYSTSDMALARYTAVETDEDGSKTLWKGVRMFLQQGDSIKIRANIFNRD